MTRICQAVAITLLLSACALTPRIDTTRPPELSFNEPAPLPLNYSDALCTK